MPTTHLRPNLDWHGIHAEPDVLVVFAQVAKGLGWLLMDSGVSPLESMAWIESAEQDNRNNKDK